MGNHQLKNFGTGFSPSLGAAPTSAARLSFISSGHRRGLTAKDALVVIYIRFWSSG
jgi:hypothetical protein